MLKALSPVSVHFVARVVCVKAIFIVGEFVYTFQFVSNPCILFDELFFDVSAASFEDKIISSWYDYTVLSFQFGWHCRLEFMSRYLLFYFRF